MDEAKRRRVAAKGWLTRVSKQMDELLQKQDISELELEDSISEFENRLKILDETQCEVEAVIDIQELEIDIQNAGVYRDERKVVLLKAKERLSFIRKQSGEEILSSSSLNNQSVIREGGVNTKLPKLELPKFAGEYTSWQTFWQKFEAVVDKSNIPDINKFTYLQSILKGEAATAIQGLSLTAENYETAKNILIKRFGRTERIIFGHIQNLMKINTRNMDGSVSALWQLHDEIQINVRSLQNLGVGGETYGVILTPLILHQLPSNIRLEWARIGEEHEGDLDFLLQFLHQEIRRRERSQTFGPESTETKQTTFAHSKTERRVNGTATALLNPGHQNRSRTTCAFCDRNHFSDQCSIIQNLDFENRRDKIKRLGLCFRNLGKHLAKDCTRNCYFCKENHHAVLCKKKMNPENTERKTVRTTVNADGHPESAHVGISFLKTESMTTIMQVVRAQVKGKEVTIMFDSGSDRSFITKSCARNLNLKVVGTECLAYCSFAEDEAREGMKEVFELNECGEQIRLIGMNTICSTMYRSPVPHEILTFFEGITFTEDYYLGRSVEVDILIGLDWYWPLIRSQTDIFGNGLVAQETAFGWMLSGVYTLNKDLRSRQRCTKTQILFCQSALRDDTVRRLWELESIGILNENETQAEDEKVLKTFNDGIHFCDGRYTVKLPWKDDKMKDLLLNNREQAEKRLLNLSKKLEKNKVLQGRYNDVLLTLEKENIIQEVPRDQIEKDRGVFYLPHRPVIREESISTKIRPVFDASCRGENGISLNDCMNAGPNLIPDLTEILIRFRRWKYGLTADITKAFLQINMNVNDQDYHRFLWNVDHQIRTMKFMRVILEMPVVLFY